MVIYFSHTENKLKISRQKKHRLEGYRLARTLNGAYYVKKWKKMAFAMASQHLKQCQKNAKFLQYISNGHKKFAYSRMTKLKKNPNVR